jgi:DMSO/TMAO reductase YedYZ molybdopterin-dependent catalytic subunit
MNLCRRKLLLATRAVLLGAGLGPLLAACSGATPPATPTPGSAPSVAVTLPTGSPAAATAAPAAKPTTKEQAEMTSLKVPPGQAVQTRFSVLDLGVKPNLPLDKWSLDVVGQVGNPQKLTWQQFQALPHVERTWDFHCVTGWTKLDIVWKGVLLSDIIALVEPKSGVVAVIFEGRDGYTTNTVYEEVANNETLVADQLQGQPLPLDHGGPARGLIPFLYGYKSAKFLSAIRFESRDIPGYWETRGYNNHADPWKQERYD